MANQWRTTGKPLANHWQTIGKLLGIIGKPLANSFLQVAYSRLTGGFPFAKL
jgi:hypothetical protein